MRHDECVQLCRNTMTRVAHTDSSFCLMCGGEAISQKMKPKQLATERDGTFRWRKLQRHVELRPSVVNTYIKQKMNENELRRKHEKIFEDRSKSVPAQYQVRGGFSFNMTRTMRSDSVGDPYGARY